MAGKGFLQGTQSRLNFLPEKQTDFIWTSFCEEFGFVGALALLVLFAVVIFYGVQTAMSARSQFGRLLAMGVTLNFFFYIMINGLMVMGLIPVVGIPMPLLSYGGIGHADGDVRLRPVDERAYPPPGGNSPPFRRDYLDLLFSGRNPLHRRCHQAFVDRGDTLCYKARPCRCSGWPRG